MLSSQGRPVAEAIRTIGVMAFTCYGWRKGFSGLKSDQVKRLKDPESLRVLLVRGLNGKCVASSFHGSNTLAPEGLASLTLRVTR